jgi:hypothetical protein
MRVDMMGRGVLLVAAAAVVAALAVFAVWLTAVVARPSKPLVPITNGTFTASYNATVICVDGEEDVGFDSCVSQRQVDQGDARRPRDPLAVFKYPHGLNYIGELLLDLNRIKDVNNETLKPLGGIINKRIAHPVPHADSPLAPRSTLFVTTSFNYSRLVIEGHGEFRNGTVSGLLIFDYEAGVPYFFIISMIHASMRKFCGTSFAYIVAYLKEVK